MLKRVHITAPLEYVSGYLKAGLLNGTIELDEEEFEEFKKNEFDGVVKKFGYTHTRNNLIMAFKANIPEYVPQQCNRWKNQK